MLILRMWNYIRGYVIIMVEGYFPEKFINVCINRGIFLWDINREKNCIITLKVGIKAFKKLRLIAKKTRCRLRIKEKRGLPFIFHRYRKRKIFAAGCIVFLGMVYLLSSFVWTVEVYGNKKLPSRQIIDSLSLVGFKTGIWKPFVDTERITNKMMIRMPELAWISIDISGTRAIIEVSERVMPPPMIEKDIPCNIIAVKDGVITSIVVRAGSPMVKVGDTVKKGDLLVAGMVESKDKVIRHVHAMADVGARTWYEETGKALLSRTKMVRTGLVECKYSIKIFNKIIGFGNIKPPAGDYDLEQDIKQAALGRNYPLPFGIIVHRYFEKKSVRENISMGQAKEEAMNEAWEKIEILLPDNENITDKKFYVEPSKKAVNVRILVECLEQIGLQERF